MLDDFNKYFGELSGDAQEILFEELGIDVSKNNAENNTLPYEHKT